MKRIGHDIVEEWHWRKKIAKEILRWCDHDIEPCLDCSELSILIKNGDRINLDNIVFE